MASGSSFSYSLLIFLMMFLTYNKHANGCYTSIISFGDSLADTGNLMQIYSNSKRDPPHFFFPPYGETFFHEVSGRCSNGRLIIDFIAEMLMLRISPYERIKTTKVVEINQGINFAVTGATSLDSSFHEAQGVRNPFTNASLGVQLKWFKEFLSSICITKSDCKKYFLHNSLILLGEIGGNDYNHPIIAGKSVDEIKAYVPLVINTIISAANDLIDLGAQTLVVPGNLPLGCSPTYLTLYHGSDNVELDNTTGCLIHLNKFAEFHNNMLQMALNQIRELHPNVNVIYADYYNAAMQFYRSPQEYGFTNGALAACCGGEGPYNYNLLVTCGDPSSKCCDHPKTYANWDGLHLTEAAYHIIYKSLFHGTYTTPQFNTLCPISNEQAIDASSSSV